MKRTSKHVSNGEADEILPHYDFSNGVRGKHYRKYREGVTVQLIGEHTNAKVVVLDDDIGEIFPDSKSVNDALRHLGERCRKGKRPDKKSSHKYRKEYQGIITVVMGVIIVTNFTKQAVQA